MKITETAENFMSKLPAAVASILTSAVRGAKNSSTRPPGITRSSMLAPDAANIIIFDVSQNSPGGHLELLEVLGEFALNRAGDEGKQLWERKLVACTSTTPTGFNEKLASGNFSTYRSLVESFTGAVERLEAIHIANALLAGGVSIGDSRNVDVKSWPLTQAFCAGEALYSVTPLVSAYFNPEIWQSFPKAFSLHVQEKLTCGRNDVSLKMKEVVDNVLDCCV